MTRTNLIPIVAIGPACETEFPRDQKSPVSRREFLGMTAASLLMAGGLNAAATPDRKSEIPYRTLGRTGEKVSLIGLGGYYLGKQSDPGREHSHYSHGNR